MNTNKIKLTKAQLTAIISESVSKTINETNIKNKQNLFESILNESMVFPHRPKKIWWDNDETFVVLGNDKRWYEVYPNYGDAYMVDCEADKLFDSYVKKIETAYLNNGVRRPQVFLYNWDEAPLIIDETGEEKYFEKINSWLQKKGFILKEAPSEDNWGAAKWEYSGEYGDDTQNAEMLTKISNMQDVTNEISHFFMGSNSPKSASISALQYLQTNK